jgi:hypothetical protein
VVAVRDSDPQQETLRDTDNSGCCVVRQLDLPTTQKWPTTAPKGMPKQ